MTVLEQPAARAGFACDPDALQVADVLLMMGVAPLSQLIAWCGDSIYSHAALVADGGDLIEASAQGVRRYPLARRLADRAEYRFVDAFRPLARDGSTLQDDDRARVLAHAKSLLGTPYPLDSLATLGVLVAVRGKLPSHWLARLVVREALDHLVRDDPSHMVCSEMVYRAFAECDAQPRGRLAPTIVLEPRGTAPFPKIDWKALWEEVWPLLRPGRQAALGEVAPRAARAGGTADAAPLLAAAVPDDGLEDSLAQARAALGVAGAQVAAAQRLRSALGDAAQPAPPIPIPDPNPKLVTPLDLAATPSHKAVGRLMEA